MARLSRLHSLLLLPFLCVLSASAQQPASPIHADSQINLDVVVTAQSGRRAADELRREDFTILDNKEAVPPTSFRVVSGNEVPVEVILVVDAVNNSYQNIAYEKGQIDKFLQANDGRLAHPTALAIVTDTGTQIQQGFSIDGNALSTDLDNFAIGLRSIHRSAGFYGAGERFELSIKALQSMVAREATRPGRKQIVWISPGWPLLSGPGIQVDAREHQKLFSSIVALSTEMRAARVTLYSVNASGVAEDLGRANYYQEYAKGVSKPGDAQLGNLGVQVLGVQTGGLVLNSTGVTEMLQQCTDDTSHYYELTFDARASERRDEYHHVEVKLSKSGLVARTRQGYYAQPQP